MLLSASDVRLPRWAVLRDQGFYLVGVIIVAVSVGTGALYWWKGLISLIIYVLYIVAVVSMTSRSIKTRILGLFQPEELQQNASSENLAEPMDMPTITIEDVDASKTPAVSKAPSVTKDEIGDVGIPITDISTLRVPRSSHRRSKSMESRGSAKQLPAVHRNISASPQPQVSLRVPMKMTDYSSSEEQEQFQMVRRGSRTPSYNSAISHQSSSSAKDDVVSENVLSLLHERMSQNQINYGVAAAVEVLGALSTLNIGSSDPHESASRPPSRQNSQPLSSPSYNPNDSLSRNSTFTSRLSIRHTNFLHLMHLCDQCSICMKTMPSNDDALEDAPSYRNSAIWRHLFPTVYLWNILGITGKIIGIINFVPVAALGLTVPIVAHLEEETRSLTMTSPIDVSFTQDLVQPTTAQRPSRTPSHSYQLRSRSPSPSSRRLQQPSSNAMDIQKLTQLHHQVQYRRVLSCDYGRVVWIRWRHRWLALVQLFLAPLLIVLSLQLGDNQIGSFTGWSIAAITGAVLAALVFVLSWSGRRVVHVSNSAMDGTCQNADCLYCMGRRVHSDWRAHVRIRLSFQYWRHQELIPMLSLVGFITGLMWIYLLSGEVVSVLQVLGRTLRVPESVMGVTVFAFGNCVGDFATDIALSRMGYPFVGIGAAWGATLLNVFVTFGIGSMLSNDAVISMSPMITVALSALILVTLSNLVVLVLWRTSMRRTYGIYLIVVWAFAITLGIVLELTLAPSSEPPPSQ